MASVVEKPAGEKGLPSEVGGEVRAAAGGGGDDDMGLVSSMWSRRGGVGGGGGGRWRVGSAWRRGEESVTTDAATVAAVAEVGRWGWPWRSGELK